MVNNNIFSQNNVNAAEISQLISNASTLTSYEIDALAELLKLKRNAISQKERKEITTWEDLDNIVGPVSWAWPLWLPNGYLTIIASQSGVGKSNLAMSIAACFLRGSDWPDGSKFEGETGAVLWCEAESAQTLNLDRARRMGLPLRDIYTPLDDPMEEFRLDNSEHIKALKMKAFLPEVKLIIIDSLSGAQPNIEKGPEEAATIKVLASLARDTNKPFIATHHLRKRGMTDSINIDIDRLRGSSALVQPARVVWALDKPDQFNESQKRLKVIKSNLGKFPKPLVVNVGDILTFGPAPEEPKQETVIDRACNLLRTTLQKGPKPAIEIEKEFNLAGISNVTRNRAKTKLGVVSRKGKNGWSWSLPEKSYS